jgi:hypothetical protein
MTWSLVRLGLFTGAFCLGMLLSHFGLHHPTAPAPVLTENAGAVLVIACKDGSVVVNGLEPKNAIHLQCVQSNMVVVRDHRPLENIPASKRTNVQFQQ